PAAVRIRQPAGYLDRDIEDPFKDLGGRPLIQAAVIDPLPQTPARQVLGEHMGDVAHPAYVVAPTHMRMQTKRHPRLRLTSEKRLVRLGMKQLGTRALH